MSARLQCGFAEQRWKCDCNCVPLPVYCASQGSKRQRGFSERLYKVEDGLVLQSGGQWSSARASRHSVAGT